MPMSATRTWGRSRARALEGLAGRGGGGHPGAVAPQADGHGFAGVVLVVHDQDAHVLERGGGLRPSFARRARCGSRSRSADAACCRGSRTINTAPGRSSRFRASTVPPCSSTRCRTMASPRPTPACWRVLEESACRKRSKTYGRNAGSIPGPSSVTESSTHEPASCEPDLHPAPHRRELDGVGQQVPDHLLQPARVTRHRTDRGIDRQLEVDVPSPRGGPHRVRGRFDHARTAAPVPRSCGTCR